RERVEADACVREAVVAGYDDRHRWQAGRPVFESRDFGRPRTAVCTRRRERGLVLEDHDGCGRDALGFVNPRGLARREGDDVDRMVEVVETIAELGGRKDW